MKNEIKIMLNELVKAFGTRMSKKTLANKIYIVLDHAGVDVTILNEKYLDVCGYEFQFIKKKTGWEVKEF